MKKKFIFLFAIFMLVISTSAYAGSTSVGLKVTTLGVGGEIGRKLSDSFALRVGAHYFPYNYSTTVDSIEYEFDLNFLSVPVLLDFHPFKGSFRISGGAVYNGNTIDATASPMGTYTIGGNSYSAALVGTLEGEIDFNTVSPYLGIGWDTTFDDDGGFGLSLGLGVLFQGSPKVDLRVTGPVADPGDFLYNPQIVADLEAEEDDLQDELDKFTIYPVVSVGISYRF